ncbi:MAG: recombinase family protein [Gemmataceae bacterium]
MFCKLEGGASYSEVADWLNEKSVNPGPYARKARWDCSLVTRFVHNPILKGVRVRNRKMSKRVNQTGRRKAVDAPLGERLERHCPHLAFVDSMRYDRLIAKLDEANARFRRKGSDGVDTRKGVPKKRTVWPGQHIDCGICGRPYVYGGHGQKDHLMCRGAHEYHCWNAVTADGPLAAQKMITAIREAIGALPDFDPVLVDMVREEQRRQHGDSDRRQKELAGRLASAEREIQNVLAAIRAGGHSPALLEELTRLEGLKSQIAWEQQQAASSATPSPVPSVGEIKSLAEQAFVNLAVTSPEFGRLLRQLIDRIVVTPHRLCDGGHPVLRARFTLRLAALLPESSGFGALDAVLERPLVVDLFSPPQREEFRHRVMERTAGGLTQREIARELGITLPAVQKAVALSRCMEALGIEDPYLPLSEPPADYHRLRRHRHRRYRFEPLKADPRGDFQAAD